MASFNGTFIVDVSQDEHDKLPVNYDPLPVSNTSNNKNRFSFSEGQISQHFSAPQSDSFYNPSNCAERTLPKIGRIKHTPNMTAVIFVPRFVIYLCSRAHKPPTHFLDARANDKNKWKRKIETTIIARRLTHCSVDARNQAKRTESIPKDENNPNKTISKMLWIRT